MNGMEDTMAPQNFLYGCKLEAGKEVVFNPEDDDFEHQLDLRMACVDATTKDELHMVEVEGQDEEGQKVKAVLASLKPSTLPSVCLGGFTITPPAVFRLKAGSGPIHISGQHLSWKVSSRLLTVRRRRKKRRRKTSRASKKRPASSPAAKSQKKLKKSSEADEEEEEEDDDEEDEDEEDDDDDTMEGSPVLAKSTPKAKNPAQNGKSPKPNTPSKNQPKTPNKDAKSPKAAKTPKKSLTVAEAVEELWKWKQTLKE
ncbi:hypothetical protein CRUP_021866 [Coryphaenoides rupestris]|nr:hypothetical protein CRUP_021866 [Coryphaenoides rupestris]